ncbi:hypothetical protein [Azotobacter beijerinckii]|uniref:Uncharacterized protein n=1 Tax=Azotobacter beijerinckii TaxID=170623 RepID=A0A1I0Z1F3_9GAMM|nr:hypothetical protein [Azotobacter beijerinckii]SFB19549.1 hypothetical protein SAMN04244571_01741 [Azotobacter beijerinckii]
MSQMDLFDSVDVSIQLRPVSTTGRDYNAIVMNVGGLRFSCDLHDGLGGDRQIQIAKRIAEAAGVEIQAHGGLGARLGRGGKSDG